MTKDQILQKLKDNKLIAKGHTMDNRILVSDAVNIVDFFLKKNPNLFGDTKIDNPSTTVVREVKYQRYRNMGYVKVDPLSIELFIKNCTINKLTHKNFMNGTFFWQGNPNGILIQDGKILCENASHAWRGYPQAILYCDIEGKVGYNVVKSAKAFPNLNRVKWCIGGFTLLGHSTPDKEGFNGAYRDVLRSTYKTSIGYSENDNKIVLGVHLVPTNYENQMLDMKSTGCKYAIGLDGGGSSALCVDGSVKQGTSRTLNSFITWK